MRGRNRNKPKSDAEICDSNSAYSTFPCDENYSRLILAI
uniref:Uncharacterized protein n=1 Tax=Romanomermis culicivorax TaxID=13658 RepID=A0A915JP10_ROMCU